MLETLTNCPLCYSGQFSNYLTCTDYTVSQQKFDIVACEQCNFKFTNPRPDAAHIGEYYQSQDYVSHANKGNSLINIIYKIARSFTLNGKIQLINSVADKGHLLDIGCGTGHFLAAAKKDGWQITGVEPDDQARAIAQKEAAQNIHQELPDKLPQKYDVVTMWHVLEHIPDLNSFIKKLLGHIHDTSTLVIAVPNYKSYDAQHYKEEWAAYDVPRHLYHFDQNTMSALMGKYGLKVDQVLPMKLDSYYVSLLSEKYKQSGLLQYFKAPWYGLKSNLSATKNFNNYSSLIYIVRK